MSLASSNVGRESALRAVAPLQDSMHCRAPTLHGGTLAVDFRPCTTLGLSPFESYRRSRLVEERSGGALFHGACQAQLLCGCHRRRRSSRLASWWEPRAQSPYATASHGECSRVDWLAHATKPASSSSIPRGQRWSRSDKSGWARALSLVCRWHVYYRPLQPCTPVPEMLGGLQVMPHAGRRVYQTTFLKSPWWQGQRERKEGTRQKQQMTIGRLPPSHSCCEIGISEFGEPAAKRNLPYCEIGVFEFGEPAAKRNQALEIEFPIFTDLSGVEGFSLGLSMDSWAYWIGEICDHHLGTTTRATSFRRIFGSIRRMVQETVARWQGSYPAISFSTLVAFVAFGVGCLVAASAPSDSSVNQCGPCDDDTLMGPRCKLPCDHGSWTSTPCRNGCRRVILHYGQHDCLRHPEFGFTHWSKSIMFACVFLAVSVDSAAVNQQILTNDASHYRGSLRQLQPFRHVFECNHSKNLSSSDRRAITVRVGGSDLRRETVGPSVLSSLLGSGTSVLAVVNAFDARLDLHGGRIRFCFRTRQQT